MKLQRNQIYHLQAAALPVAVCQAILDVFNEPGAAEVHSPLRGSRVDEAIRRSAVQILEATHWVCGLMRHLCDGANREIWKYDITCLQVAQLTRYDVGGFFDWHKDTEDGIYGDEERPEWRGLVRKLSIIVPLSPTDAYAGGNFEIKDEYGYVWKDPSFREQGTGIVFPSRQLHRVTGIEKGERSSVVAWALGPPLR